MNAAKTLARVYVDLKSRIMSGEFAPGDRLDPSILAHDLNSSTTPVREALHRLAGERMVANHSNEGFRLPLVSEAGLRDLYGWSAALLSMALRGGDKFRDAAVRFESLGYAADLGIAFEAISKASPNHEIWIAIANLNDRSHHIRIVEQDVLEGALEERDDLLSAIGTTNADLRSTLARFHRRRVAAIPALASRLRPREGVR